MISSESLDNESNSTDGQTGIATGGGTYVGENVSAGRDFVGRDSTAIYAATVYIGNLPPDETDILADEPSPGDPPFKGLEYFDVNDADLFFGREELTSELLHILCQQRFLAIVGASGSGKSSLVRAGIVAALKRGVPPTPGAPMPSAAQEWLVHIITPTARPLESIAATLTSHAESVTATSTLIDDLQKDDRSLHLYITRLLSGKKTAVKALIVVDQFEELFTQSHNFTEQRAFVDALLVAALHHDRTVVVITLRADFYAHCARFDTLRTALEQYQKFIGAPERDELRRAVEEPALRGQWHFEPTLVDQMLDDVGREPGALPLLAHALLETWKRRKGRTLTHMGYNAAGRVQKAIAVSAETVYQQGLTAAEQTLARTLFLRLTEPGEGTQDTRRRVFWGDLVPEGIDAEEVATIVQRLADQRLLTTGKDDVNGQRFVEVAHEALIREWPTLRRWLDEDREGLLILRRLSQAAKDWEEDNEEAGFLYRGLPLQQTIEWAAQNVGRMNPREQRFLTASRQAELREQAEREQSRLRAELDQAELAAEQARSNAQAQHNQRLRLLRNILAGVALLALIATGFAVRQSISAGNAETAALTAKDSAEAAGKDADHQRQLAVTEAANAQQSAVEAAQAQAKAEALNQIIRSDQLAAQSLVALDQSPPRSLLLSSEAINIWRERSTLPDPIVEQTMRNLLLQTGGIPFRAPPNGANDTDEITANRIADAKVSPNGRWLALLFIEGFVQLWDVETLQVVASQLRDSEAKMTGIAFSTDSQYLLGGDEAGAIGLWKLGDPTVAAAMQIDTPSAINMIAESSDHKLAAAGIDGAIRLWSAIDPAAEPQILTVAGQITRITFNQNGLWLAASYYDRSGHYIAMWDLATTDPLAPPTILTPVSGIENHVLALAFSPDEKHFVVANAYAVQMWNIAVDRTFSDPIVLGHHGGWILTVAISADSQWVAAGGYTGQLTLWNLQGADPAKTALPLRGHTGNVTSASFSEDGRWLVTASDDTTVWLWQVSDNPISSVVLRGHEFGVRTAAFDATQHWLVTVDSSGGGRLWAMPEQSVAHADLLRGIHSDLTRATTAAAERWLAIGRGNTIELWDHMRPTAPFILTGHTDDISNLVIRADERWLASLSKDATIRLWDLTTPEYASVTLSGTVTWAESIVFSPDHKWLAVGTGEQTVMLWDLDKLSADPILLKQDAAIRDLAFSADGKLLVSGSGHQSHAGVSAYVWNLAAADPSLDPMILSGHTDIVRHVAISPDGRWIGTGSWDRSARLWDLSTDDPAANPLILPFGDRSFPVTFSPDGHWFVAVAADGTFYVVDITQADTPPVHITAHRWRILAVKFARDGERFATFGEDSLTKVWNPNDLLTPIVQANGDADLGMVAFSPDRRARYWELAPDALTKLACRTAGRNLTQDEWQQYLSDFPYRETCQDDSNNQVVSQHLIDIGVDLAETDHNVDEAAEKFRLALQLNPQLAFDPLAEAKRVAVQALIAEGRALLQTEKVNEADQKFTAAHMLDPALTIDAKAEAVVASVDRSRALLASGDVTGTLATLSHAQALSTTMSITTALTASEWNSLCWIGSIEGLAAQVLAACERAVTLAPNDGGIRDSRGLALALTGDFPGAIRDFAFAVEWAKQTGELDSNFIDSRERWIARLRENRNPFDAPTLESLR